MRREALDLYNAVRAGVNPSAEAQSAFGIASPEHYHALFYPIYYGELSAGDLEQLADNGRAITMAVNQCESNPYPGIEFHTLGDQKTRLVAGIGDPQAETREERLSRWRLEDAIRDMRELYDAGVESMNERMWSYAQDTFELVESRSNDLLEQMADPKSAVPDDKSAREQLEAIRDNAADYAADIRRTPKSRRAKSLEPYEELIPDKFYFSARKRQREEPERISVSTGPERATRETKKKEAPKTAAEAVFGARQAAADPKETWKDLYYKESDSPIPGGIIAVPFDDILEFFEQTNPEGIPFIRDTLVNFGNGMVGLGLYGIRSAKPQMGPSGPKEAFIWYSDVVLFPDSGERPPVRLKAPFNAAGTWYQLLEKPGQGPVDVNPLSYIVRGETAGSLVPLEPLDVGAILDIPVAFFGSAEGKPACAAIFAPILGLLQKITVGDLRAYSWLTPMAGPGRRGATQPVISDPVFFYNTASGQLVAIVRPLSTERITSDPQLHEFFAKGGKDTSAAVNESIMAVCTGGKGR